MKKSVIIILFICNACLVPSTPHTSVFVPIQKYERGCSSVPYGDWNKECYNIKIEDSIEISSFIYMRSVTPSKIIDLIYTLKVLNKSDKDTHFLFKELTLNLRPTETFIIKKERGLEKISPNDSVEIVIKYENRRREIDNRFNLMKDTIVANVLVNNINYEILYRFHKYR